MTSAKNASINIGLMVILIAISLFENEVSAQESDGAVKSAATGHEFHIASYSKIDKPLTYPVERPWSDHWDKPSDGRQHSDTGNGADLRVCESQDIDDDGTIDATLTLAFGTTGTDADPFNLGGDIDWHLPNMKTLYASVDPGIRLSGFYGGTTAIGATDLSWTQIDSDNSFYWEDPLAWEEEKTNDDQAGFREWSLPDTQKLNRLVDYAFFPDMTDFSASGAIFDATSTSNATGQNNPTGPDLETDQALIGATDLSSLSAEQTGQIHYWPGNYYNDGISGDEMYSVNYVNILSIDYNGSIGGIAKKINGWLP